MTKTVDNHTPNLKSGSSGGVIVAPAAMAHETVYILQAYVAGRGKGIGKLSRRSVAKRRKKPGEKRSGLHHFVLASSLSLRRRM